MILLRNYKSCLRRRIYIDIIRNKNININKKPNGRLRNYIMQSFMNDVDLLRNKNVKENLQLIIDAMEYEQYDIGEYILPFMRFLQTQDQRFINEEMS